MCEVFHWYPQASQIILRGEKVNSRKIRIIGSGMALPTQQVSAEELDQRLDLRPGSTFRQTGVQRRFLSTTETAAQLAARACETALAATGLRWDDIDCLV